MLLIALPACRQAVPERQEQTPDAAGSAVPGALGRRAPGDASADLGPPRIVLETAAMGTLVRIVAYTGPGADEAAVRRAIGRAIDEFRRIDRLMSNWRPDSEVSAVNARAGERVRVGDDTYRVLDKSLWAGRISSGVFDITFETMGDLWKFGDAAEAQPTVPSSRAIAEKKALLGFAKIELDPRSEEVRIPKGRRIGLGGIAKGYAVDRAADVLRREGVQSFVLQAGGDIYAAGRKPDGEPWSTGIQDPRAARGSMFATLELSDQGLSTAGDYERFFVVNGKRYHHIIDPRTGYPATASRAVSVSAPDSLTADAVDDCVFILGPQKGLELVESLPDVGAVIVDADNKVWVSQRMRKTLRVTRDPTP